MSVGPRSRGSLPGLDMPLQRGGRVRDPGRSVPGAGLPDTHEGPESLRIRYRDRHRKPLHQQHGRAPEIALRLHVQGFENHQLTDLKVSSKNESEL